MARNSEFYSAENGKELVYAPSNGSLAYRTDYVYRTAQLAPTQKRRQQTEKRNQKRAKAERTPFSLREFLKQNRFLPKLFVVGCAAAVTAVAFFTATRFAGIAGVQADINELNGSIEAAGESIRELNLSSQPVVNAAEFAEAVGLVQPQP